MQEILVVIVIGLAVLLLPRLLNRNRAAQSQSGSRPSVKSTSGIKLTGWMRLIIVLSVLWITGCAAYLKPWEKNTFLFLCISFGPVIILWGGIWVWAGYIKYRR